MWVSAQCMGRPSQIRGLQCPLPLRHRGLHNFSRNLTPDSTHYLSEMAEMRYQVRDKSWPSLAVKEFIFPLFLAGCAFGNSVLAQSQQPNIVADDMGCGAVSYNGSPYFQTPNIEAFAGNGILCTNGYVTYPFFTNAPNGIHAQKSARVEFSTTSQSVAGHEIHGFSARHAGKARKETLIPPAGLKPVEQEAWLAMSRRQGARAGMEFTSFYPTRYNEPFVVQGEGVRVAVRAVRGTDTAV